MKVCRRCKTELRGCPSCFLPVCGCKGNGMLRLHYRGGKAIRVTVPNDVMKRSPSDPEYTLQPRRRP